MSNTAPSTRDSKSIMEAKKAEEMAIKQWLAALADADALPDIRASVQRLRQLLTQHFADTESPDGLFEEVRLVEPITAPKVDALVAEHHELRQQLVGLGRLIDDAAAAMGRLAEAKLSFIKHVKDCEASERSLVVDAYYMDLGGGD